MPLSVVIVPALQGQVTQQQQIMLDLRRENFVTQGAFKAAQLCKADTGTVKLQRGRLDLVSNLLVSAGILEEGAGGGLSIRKCTAVDTTRTLKEGIARAEKAARAAADRAQRAAGEAAKAQTIAEEVADRCRQVDQRCSTISTRCSEVKEDIVEDRQRIETNSTRIFHLAAKVERLAETQHVVHRPTGQQLTCRETRDIIAVEIADLALQERCKDTASAGSHVESAPAETPNQRENSLFNSRKENDVDVPNGVVPIVLSTHKGSVPCRPGVLDESEHDCLVQAIRPAFLAANQKNIASPNAWRRAKCFGRTPIKEKDGAQMGHPVRSKVDHPRTKQAAPNSWARASWPLLANKEVGCTRAKDNENADIAPVKVLMRHESTPNVARGTVHDKFGKETKTNTRQESTIKSANHSIVVTCGDTTDVTSGSTAVADKINASRPRAHDNAARSAVNASTQYLLDKGSRCSPPHHAEGITTNGSKASVETGPAGKCKNNKAGDLVAGVLGLPQGDDHKNTRGRNEHWDTAIEEGYGGNADSQEVTTAARGTTLACLEGAPTLWCPRDSWDVRAEPSSVGSTSTAGRGEDSSETVLGDPAINTTDQDEVGEPGVAIDIRG